MPSKEVQARILEKLAEGPISLPDLSKSLGFKGMVPIFNELLPSLEGLYSGGHKHPLVRVCIDQKEKLDGRRVFYLSSTENQLIADGKISTVTSIPPGPAELGTVDQMISLFGLEYKQKLGKER